MDALYKSTFTLLYFTLLKVVLICLGVYDTPQHIRLIQTNYRLLSEKLDLDNGLLSELYSKEVITHREMEAIKAEKTSYDRNEKLLNILRRKSEAKFQQFIVALRATNMAELAAVLEIQS